jgi:hypothetical protein
MIKKKTSRSVKYLCALSLAMCLLLGALVFWTGQHVHDLKTDLGVKNQQLLKEQERLRVLRAEWSHLNSPKRLDELMQLRENLDDPYSGYEDLKRPEFEGTRINDVGHGGANE